MDVEAPHVRWSRDVGRAHWIGERLTPLRRNRITSVVPGGFEAYARLPDPIPSEVRDGPRVDLPSRRYLLYSGDRPAPLAWIPSQRQTPNLWWADDKSWCVATEIDLIETYVGGPRTLIDQILADGRLETLPADTDDAIQLSENGHVAQLAGDIAAKLLASGSTAAAHPRRPVQSVTACGPPGQQSPTTNSS